MSSLEAVLFSGVPFRTRRNNPLKVSHFTKLLVSCPTKQIHCASKDDLNPQAIYRKEVEI
jgi:hypothetical protein